LTRQGRGHWCVRTVLGALLLAVGSSLEAQVPPYKIADADLAIDAVSAVVESQNPVVPKNVATGIRIVVSAGGRPLTGEEAAQFLGGPVEVRAEVTGPGLSQTLRLASAGSEDPLLLRVPPLAAAGEYGIANLRVVAAGRTVLDVRPARVTLRVLEKILITGVEARPLSYAEIVSKGIVIDQDAYLTFEFTFALKLESTPINVAFPVVFDRRGVAISPPLPLPPPVPVRSGPVRLPPLPPIVPVLLTAGSPGGGDGAPGPPLELGDLGTPAGIGFRACS
jgi:hypothetical protein